MKKRFLIDLRRSLFISTIVTFTLGIAVANLIVSHPKKPSNDIVSLRKQEIDFWKQIVESNPTYRDAYLQIAKLEKLNGNEERALDAIMRAKIIDPNKD